MSAVEPFSVSIPTRWMDTDAHGHVNNVQYLSYFDTAVTTWLIEVAGLDVRIAPVIGLCVHSECDFHAPLTFPQTFDSRIAVRKIGRTSVTYAITLTNPGDGSTIATGSFVHVYVDRDSRRPTTLPAGLLDALQGLPLHSG